MTLTSLIHECWIDNTIGHSVHSRTNPADLAYWSARCR